MAKSKIMVGEVPSRPKFDELLLHPIHEVDNGMPPQGVKFDERRTGDDSETSYTDWSIDHAETARFYLGGFNAIKSRTREKNARHFYTFAEKVIEVIREERWDQHIKGNWHSPASYNQFRKAIISGEPMYFDLAVHVVVACELALQTAIDNGHYGGHRNDVYSLMKIIPACYSIDSFNVETLNSLRDDIVNCDQSILTAAGQRSSHLLTQMASGSCVTRKTAQAIRWKTLQMLDGRENVRVDIGDVRGRPGRKKLGRKNAASTEMVDLDDPSARS